MKGLAYGRGALGICATVAALLGCSGLQPPIGAPGATQESARIAAPTVSAARTIVPRILSASSYQVLYSFRGGSDGKFLRSRGLISGNGTLYGTTS